MVRLHKSLLLCFLLIVVFAGRSIACDRSTADIGEGWVEYRSGEFLYQYALRGIHAINVEEVEPTVPRIVLDVDVQLQAAKHIFQTLGYRGPLQSDRYRSQKVTVIVVRFMNLRGMGLAFDEVARTKDGECALFIHLSNGIKTGNVTPAHEYFHQIQNGYAPFKRTWFYEGTARWSESVLAQRDVQVRPLPQTPDELSQLWQESYSAFSAWNALAEQCDANGHRMPLTAQWRNLRYSNGQAVVLDDVLPGHGFMLRVLKALGALGERLSPHEGVLPHRWPEALQRDPKHDAAMWQAVQQACRP